MERNRILLMVLAIGWMAVGNSWSQERLLAWGDQGNGTYINPILNTDYSDPDVIRVGEKYYMVASDFHFLGMQILESKDMVNWRILTQVFHRFDLEGWDSNQHYAGGVWAPALRYHDGKFWIYFCTPHEGLFMTQAEHPEGPWAPLHQVRKAWHWEDPCPFWDEDGKAYLGRSQHGAGPIIIHRMSEDGRQLLDEGVTVYTGPVAEGTKIHRWNDFYYISIPEGGVGEGWQTILRAKNIYGPYEKKVVLEQGSTGVNGPHQGAIVDSPDGKWWFFHFQHDGALGRVVHLQPVSWKDGWPVMGVDIDRNGIGEPVDVWRMPTDSRGPYLPQTSDNFDKLALQPQWQWNHNPDDSAWSLKENKGKMTLHALKANSFVEARNTLTQRTMGYESVATVAIDFKLLQEGGRCGLACMGKGNQLLGVVRKNGACQLYREDNGKEQILRPLKGHALYLRISFDFPQKNFRFAYSTDNKNFHQVDESFFVGFGNWKGVRFGIYHYNMEKSGGAILLDYVTYDILR